MRCQPYFATKTAAACPQEGHCSEANDHGSTVRRRVIEVPWVGALPGLQLSAPRRVRYSWGLWGPKLRRLKRCFACFARLDRALRRIVEGEAIPDSVTRPTGSFCPARDLAILPRFRPSRDLRELPPSQVPAWPSGLLAHHEPPQARARSNSASRISAGRGSP